MARQSRVSAHNDYEENSDGDKSSEGSGNITPHNLDGVVGGFARGGLGGEGNCSVDEFSVQKCVMHFIGQSIDQRNHLNAEFFSSYRVACL